MSSKSFKLPTHGEIADGRRKVHLELGNRLSPDGTFKKGETALGSDTKVFLVKKILPLLEKRWDQAVKSQAKYELRLFSSHVLFRSKMEWVVDSLEAYSENLAKIIREVKRDQIDSEALSNLNKFLDIEEVESKKRWNRLKAFIRRE